MFTASGKAIQFAGFLRAYVEGSDDPAAALDDQETILPTLSRGQAIGAEGDPGATLPGSTRRATRPRRRRATPTPRW